MSTATATTTATARLIGSAPVLLVANVVDAANHYHDCLGFAYERFWGEPPCFCIVHRDGLHLMLRQVDPSHVVPHHTVVENLFDAYFWVDDVEALYRDMKARGATIDFEPYDQPHGCREFGIKDLDGHDIVFGQDMEPA